MLIKILSGWKPSIAKDMWNDYRSMHYIYVQIWSKVNQKELSCQLGAAMYAFVETKEYIFHILDAGFLLQ